MFVVLLWCGVAVVGGVFACSWWWVRHVGWAGPVVGRGGIMVLANSLLACRIHLTFIDVQYPGLVVELV